MYEGLKLDYLVEAKSTLDSYVEALTTGGEEDTTPLTEAVAFSLMSIAESLASIASGLGGGR